jgi:hypothetical protein
MVERQLFIDFAELETVEVSCQCGAAAVLPPGKELKGEGRCPSCEQSLLGAAIALNHLRQFITEAKKSKYGFKFRIEEE